MLPKHLIAFLLPSITIATNTPQTPNIAHNHDLKAIQKPPSVIITGPSSLNITHLLFHKNPDFLRVSHNTYRLGDTTFHSFAFSLREEWQFALRGSYNLARFTPESESESTGDRLPGLVWVQGDQLYARLGVWRWGGGMWFLFW
ncbi:hypothetical protein CNMCM6106_006467 [Aspergillus hiratsukae]|uniref:Uncharacterized protein n=1 Tax=Aspergillus hiratsukae TaxID=1194566 RepID=A0A8H6QHA3_9EURO|nr:hypothetical protein CNMCM6106_006467 [Aspergillus hiratsukae]